VPTSVLVVEDDPVIIDLISLTMEFEGWTVHQAADAFEGLEQARQHHPDVVLSDVMMPGRDGWEVCRLMRQHPALGKRVRIIMVTALDEWDDKRQALQTGADDYVAKPFDLPKLAATVERNAALLAPA